MKIPAQKAVLTVLSIFTALNLYQLTTRAIVQSQPSQGQPLHSLADQFRGLEKIFSGLLRAGYYSDKNMEHPLAIAQFEQAQYVLAPTVLELNNTSLPLVIFDCTDPKIALQKIEELKFKPLTISNTGIVIAINPDFKP